ncbi:hypothetical protein EMCRGX_G008435 [Ephydatia muelleri]|eukprot:Em0002g149a
MYGTVHSFLTCLTFATTHVRKQECCPTRSLFKYTDSPLILPFENASLHLGARDKACWKRLNGVNLIQGISYTRGASK